MFKQDRNQPDVNPEKLKALGILKVLKVVIGENEPEPKYLCLKEDGTTIVVPESEIK